MDFGLSFFGSGLSFEFFSPKLLGFFSVYASVKTFVKSCISAIISRNFSALRALISALFFKIQTCLKTSFGGTSVKKR